MNGDYLFLWTMLAFIAGIIFERNFPKKGSRMFGHMMTGVFVLFVLMILAQSGILTALWQSITGA